MGLEFSPVLIKLYNDAGRPMSWVTPTGMPVLNSYYKPDVISVAIPLRSGHRKYIELTIGDTDEINKHKALGSITANYTHSMDASHLAMVAVMASREGIDTVTAHDCYACLAPDAARFNEIIVDRLAALYQRFFVLRNIWLHVARDLGILVETADGRLIDGKRIKMPDPPAWGNLDVNGIRGATNAFR
jgi:DNA-directed RNA polymerase